MKIKYKNINFVGYTRFFTLTFDSHKFEPTEQYANLSRTDWK